MKNKGKIANRNIFVLDQGYYGFTTCSLCECNVENIYDICPNCEATLGTTITDYNKGGSDF